MDESYQRAKKRLEDLNEFYKHLTIYIIVNPFLVVVIYLNKPWNLLVFIYNSHMGNSRYYTLYNRIFKTQNLPQGMGRSVKSRSTK